MGSLILFVAMLVSALAGWFGGRLYERIDATEKAAERGNAR